MLGPVENIPRIPAATLPSAVWQSFLTAPAEPGEYRAALCPGDVGPDMRRWWTGRYWSEPYSVWWSEETKARCRATATLFMVYWQVPAKAH